MFKSFNTLISFGKSLFVKEDETDVICFSLLFLDIFIFWEHCLNSSSELIISLIRTEKLAGIINFLNDEVDVKS